jgi:hypothetical protein
MAERLRTSQALTDLIWREGQSVIEQIITMDESAVSMHAPETKQQSKQWHGKVVPGPVKAKVHTTMTKTTVLAFFLTP